MPAIELFGENVVPFSRKQFLTVNLLFEIPKGNKHLNLLYAF